MFNNIDDIKKFIEEENIVNLDIRSVSEGVVKCVTFNVMFIDKVLFEKFQDENISIEGLDLNSYFVEVFLAHKTLVIFAEDLKLINEYSYEKTNKYSFIITDDDTGINALASPSTNKYRDFVGEIVSALNDMGESFAYFYRDTNDYHTIVLQKSNRYSKTKVNYSIRMVAKAYNISIPKIDANLDNLVLFNLEVK